MDTDKELFKSALAPDTPEPAPEPSEAPAPDPATEQQATPAPERERDEKGRFVPKGNAEEAPVPPPVEPTEANVPSFRLREQTQAREVAEAKARDLEVQLAVYRAQQQQKAWQQQQPPPPPPADMFADPEGWQNQQNQQVADVIAFQRYEFSEMLARQSVGDQKVEDALNWANSNLGPSEKVRIQNARHPFGELLRLQDERKVLSEIGTDPQAYVQRKLEEALNNPEFLARAVEKIKGQAGQPNGKTAPVVNLPPSLSRATAAAPTHEEVLGELTNANLFAEAMKR